MNIDGGNGMWFIWASVLLELFIDVAFVSIVFVFKCRKRIKSVWADKDGLKFFNSGILVKLVEERLRVELL